MLAGLITKILGVINKIILARVVGAEGMGLFNMAFPTLMLTVTLTQLGLPVAISKLVAEAEAHNDRKKIKRILTVSFFVVGTLSIILTLAMIAITPVLAKTVFTDERTLYPLIAIAPIVPIVAVSSVLRGYFQGIQNMKPYATAQVIEQIVRITLVYLLASALLPLGIEYAAAGAMISGVIGELASLLFMLAMFKAKKRVKVRQNFFTHLAGGRRTLFQLMHVALPTTGSRLIGSISNFLEPIVVSHSLLLAGVSVTMATKQYGMLTGFAIPLLVLPSFITHSLHVSLIPTISEAAAKNHIGTIHYRLNQALKIAMIAGGISIVISYVFAEPILDLMYDSPDSAVFVYMMAPFFFLFYFQGPLQAVLQALNLASAAMINSLVGAVVKILTMLALASRPEFGIMGAAIGVVVSVILVTLLHLVTVIKSIGFSLKIMDYIKGISALLLAGVFAEMCQQYLLTSWTMLPRTLTLISLVVIVYMTLAVSLRLINREELSHIPIIKRWIT